MTFETEARQRFRALRDAGWTLHQISEATGLKYSWLEEYAKARSADTDHGARKLQEIWDLYEEWSE